MNRILCFVLVVALTFVPLSCETGGPSRADDADGVKRVSVTVTGLTGADGTTCNRCVRNVIRELEGYPTVRVEHAGGGDFELRYDPRHVDARELQEVIESERLRHAGHGPYIIQRWQERK